MKTILVTGGAGFIGSNLIEQLVKDPQNTVYSLDNYSTGSKNNHIKGATYITGDTNDIAKLVTAVPVLVYHLGEYARVEKSFEDMPLVWHSNKAGTFAVLEFCRKHGAKIVYAGSSTKFGDGGLGRNQSPYAWSKASNTELVQNYGAWFNLPFAITYFYNVYGQRELSGAYGTVVEIFRQARLHGEPLKVVAPGTQTRIFTNVDDIVHGLLLVGEKGSGDGYGLGAEETYSILDIAKMFGGEIEMLPERKGNRMSSSIDLSRSEGELGWRAKKNLAEYIGSVLN
ncbi:MAG TPA: ADP-L-glycero-D-manno-heptose-6-epimerase [Candidatus Taylorbacteria bacterium]|nr:MAG: NAD-dependent epimerase/dehydratase [Parcubacteria group bacterium GW2011_GWA2_47_64]KKU97140.1 MAG: NAD-dependent epimerase/dehydratase [Parcubacteria group bacterium GW2011_GWC2_48_17]HBV01592.1 ADP-L-glycero-D-manno-heptose-6-epimerase [Candidatus Taylorbacteria bacterium]